MWGRRRKAVDQTPEKPPPLREALRQARIESAERTGVVLEMRDAEIARLEILNEALDPIFADVPPDIDLFDRGISRGDQPRLWIDVVAHVAMGRDKHVYRFLLDSRYGRKVLAESADVGEIVPAVTAYVARRMIERERELSGEVRLAETDPLRAARARRWRMLETFILGLLLGAIAVLVAAWLAAAQV